MGLGQWIDLTRGTKRIQTLALRVAEETINALWDSIGPRIARMQLTELRGYVRARTRLAVQQRSSALARQDARLGDSFVGRLNQLALDEVIRMAVAKVLGTPVKLSPVVIRRAA